MSALDRATLIEKLSAVEGISDDVEYLNALREIISEVSPVRGHPVDLVKWVPVDSVEANDYNPNSVGGKEMSLLYSSIKHDGYTQPVVTVYDASEDKYIIVDGFHRYFTLKSSTDLMESTGGQLPIVVLDKSKNDRMAATVRHNRARGKHSVTGMSNMVFEMLDNGWQDAEICNHLGMEPDELLRLKHITGFSKLFKDAEYNKAWVSRHQIRLAKEHGVKPM